MDYLHKHKQLLKSKSPELCQFPKINNYIDFID